MKYHTHYFMQPGTRVTWRRSVTSRLRWSDGRVRLWEKWSCYISECSSWGSQSRAPGHAQNVAGPASHTWADPWPRLWLHAVCSTAGLSHLKKQNKHTQVSVMTWFKTDILWKSTLIFITLSFLWNNFVFTYSDTHNSKYPSAAGPV